MRTSELAGRVGVSSDTVRYYEKEGLLPGPSRTDSGYRQYEEESVERLLFIRGAQTLGLKLRDIRDLLEIRDRGACPCGHTKQLVERRMAEIDTEIARLGVLRLELSSMRTTECSGEATAPWPCQIEFVKRGGERVG